MILNVKTQSNDYNITLERGSINRVGECCDISKKALNAVRNNNRAASSEALKAIKGVKSVTADHEACKVNVEFKKDVDDNTISLVKEAIERLDFKVEE